MSIKTALSICILSACSILAAVYAVPVHAVESTTPAPETKIEVAPVKPIQDLNALEQIAYLATIACKQYNCNSTTAKTVATAVFYQECGGIPNCNGHSPAYRGSYALDSDQFRTGFATYLAIARQHDPVYFEILSAAYKQSVATGGDGRQVHLLNAAAWYGNKARYIPGIERATDNPYQQGAMGMMMQLMPTLTHRALMSSVSDEIFKMRINADAARALQLNAIQLGVGATGADVINAMLNRYQGMKKGVGVALGTAVPNAASLTKGLSQYTSNGIGNGIFGTVNGSPIASYYNPFNSSLATNPSTQNAQLQDYGTAYPQSTNQSGTGQGSQYGYNPYANSNMYPRTDSSLSGSTSTYSNDSIDGYTDDSESVASIICEDSRVEWQCASPTTISRGISKPYDASFNTRGSMIGSLKVNPTQRTVYTIQCLKSQQVIDSTECELSPQQSGFIPTAGESDDDVSITSANGVTISVSPQSAQVGDFVTVTWNGRGNESCAVLGAGLKSSALTGTADTELFTTRGTKTYTITCENDTGEKLQARAQVVVQ